MGRVTVLMYSQILIFTLHASKQPGRLFFIDVHAT